MVYTDPSYDGNAAALVTDLVLNVFMVDDNDAVKKVRLEMEEEDGLRLVRFSEVVVWRGLIVVCGVGGNEFVLGSTMLSFFLFHRHPGYQRSLPVGLLPRGRAPAPATSFGRRRCGRRRRRRPVVP